MATARSLSPVEFVLPPGPRRNLLWSALRRLRPVDPLRLLPHLARAYGDTVYYRVGTMGFVLLSDPEYIRQILTVQPEKFIKERTVQRSRMLLGDGMLTAEGQAHRRQRQAAQPAFHRRQVPEYAATMAACARDVSDRWRDGARLDVLQEMICLTLRVVGQALFRTDINDEVHELAAAINSIMGMYYWLVALPAVERLVTLPLPGIGRFTRLRGRLDKLVHRMIDEHRRAGAAGNAPDDLLSAMFASHPSPATDDALRDEVITILLAGYETTANALTWTWYLLSQNPEAECALRAEIDTVLAGRLPGFDDLPKLVYTRMVIAESMRLFPPAWAMGRKAVEEFQVGEYVFPPGTTAVMSQWVMHRDQRFFPDPLRFDPQRFNPQAEARRPRFAYFPFGAGSRQCIGEEFAWTEMILVLATLAQKWKLRLIPGSRIQPEALITLRPKYGMPMICNLVI